MASRMLKSALSHCPTFRQFKATTKRLTTITTFRQEFKTRLAAASQFSTRKYPSGTILTQFCIHMIMWCMILAFAGCGNENGPILLKDGDTVTVHYHGTLDNGEVFDSSRERDPLTFVLGQSQVIPGFEAAVQANAGKMKSMVEGALK